MDRREAVGELQRMLDGIEEVQAYSQMSKSQYEDGYRRMDALRMAINALQPPTPDPETGLVPCGCGGELELHKRPLSNYGKDKDKYQYWVFCRKCHLSTMDYLSADLAKYYANKAMGWEGEKE